jgi:hypothetical protein
MTNTGGHRVNAALTSAHRSPSDHRNQRLPPTARSKPIVGSDHPVLHALGLAHLGSQIVDTERMGQWHVDRRPDGGGTPAWATVRWMLLAAALAGLFGMHILTDGDGDGGDLAPVPAAQSYSGDHGMTGAVRQVPTAFDAGGTAVKARSAAVVSAAPNGGLGVGHGMAQCVLFLVTVGSALLLALLASRWPATTCRPLAAVTVIWGEVRRSGVRYADLG